MEHPFLLSTERAASNISVFVNTSRNISNTNDFTNLIPVLSRHLRPSISWYSHCFRLLCSALRCQATFVHVPPFLVSHVSCLLAWLTFCRSMSCVLHCFAIGAILCVYFLFLSSIVVSLPSFYQVQVPHTKSQLISRGAHWAMQIYMSHPIC